MKSMKAMKGKAVKPARIQPKKFTRLMNETEPDRSVQLINLHALHVLHGEITFGF